MVWTIKHINVYYNQHDISFWRQFLDWNPILDLEETYRRLWSLEIASYITLATYTGA